MNKDKFLSKLKFKLSKLPEEDRENALRYYIEYFEDAGPEQEQEILNELGDPEQVAAQILSEYAIHSMESQPKSMKKGLSAVWLIIASVFAAPVALPLAIAAVAVALVLVVCLFAVLISLFAVVVSILATGLACILAALYVAFYHFPTALTIGGLGLLTSGLGLLLLPPVYALARKSIHGLAYLFQRIFRRRQSA